MKLYILGGREELSKQVTVATKPNTGTSEEHTLN